MTALFNNIRSIVLRPENLTGCTFDEFIDKLYDLKSRVRARHTDNGEEIVLVLNDQKGVDSFGQEFHRKMDELIKSHVASTTAINWW